MKGVLTILGHALIVVLCFSAAIILNGSFIATGYTVDGVDITRLSTAAAAEKIRAGKLAVTAHIGPWFDLPLPGPEMQAVLMPATAAVLLLIVYGPGVMWPAARRLPVRFGITAAVVAMVLLAMQYGGAYRV